MNEITTIVSNMCMTYRHDFGLLSEQEKLSIAQKMQGLYFSYNAQKDSTILAEKFSIPVSTVEQLIHVITENVITYNSSEVDVETHIMSCWNIIEDLKTLEVGVLEKNLSKDEISNVLSGLKTLYEMRFQDLFSEYEKSLKIKR